MERILESKLWSVASQFIITSLIFLGLVLLAWGWDDLAGFFSNPIRLSYAIIVGVQTIVNSWMVYITPKHTEQGQYYDVPRWHLYVFEAILVLAAFDDRRNMLTWNENTPLRWLGLVIYLSGWCLALWTNATWINHLRRQGEFACENPVLMFEGPYKWIRFPSLLYLAIYSLGIAMLFRSWMGLALMLPMIWGIVNRINGLEKIYAVRYKKVWSLRRHTSKRLIPRVF